MAKKKKKINHYGLDEPMDTKKQRRALKLRIYRELKKQSLEEYIRQKREKTTSRQPSRKVVVANILNYFKLDIRDLYSKSICKGSPSSEAVALVNENCCPTGNCTQTRKKWMHLFFAFAHKSQIVYYCSCRDLITTLVMNHMMPASCRQPKSAVHFGALDMMLHKQTGPQTTVVAWAKYFNKRNEEDVNKGPKLSKDILNMAFLIYSQLKLPVEDASS